MGPYKTDIVADYISTTAFDGLPRDVVHLAKTAILDSIGCAFGGVTAEFGQYDLEIVKEMAGTPEATIIGDGTRVPAMHAAFVNTVLANVMDYDDTYLRASSHPGAPIIQSALALAEKSGASGKALIAAVVTGYEVALRIGLAVRPSAERLRQGPITGWLVFGPAAAGANMLGFDADTARRVLGIAGRGLTGRARSPQGADGLGENDPKTGRYKIGFALSSLLGVLSVLRAAKGYPSPRAILDSSFWTALGSDRCVYDEIVNGLGSEYRLREVGFKPYPSCRWLNPPVDAVRAVLQEHSLETENIERVRVSAYKVLEGLGRIRRPMSMLEAEFSLPYAIAMALLETPAGPRWYQPRHFQDPLVQRLEDLVEVETDPRADTLCFEEGRLICTVEITTRDGDTYSHYVAVPRGEPDNPMSDEEFAEKFMGLAEPVIGAERSRRLLGTLMELETVPNIHEATELFGPVARQ
ncbi:MAG: MmgE/PrpD family protein [Anaerolineae bacterium]